MKIITIASLKGGVGKTVTAVYLSQALSVKGHHVLAVDIDHNNNLTDYFLRNIKSETLERRNIYQALTGELSYEDVIYNHEFTLSILPATPGLAVINIAMANDPGGVLRFQTKLRRMDFDYIVIDTPPFLTFELNCALYAADLVLSPISFHRWMLQGYNLLNSQIEKVEETIGKKLELLGLPSIVTKREAETVQKLPLPMTRTVVYKSAAIKRASGEGERLRESTKAWEYFFALAEELQ